MASRHGVLRWRGAGRSLPSSAGYSRSASEARDDRKAQYAGLWRSSRGLARRASSAGRARVDSSAATVRGFDIVTGPAQGASWAGDGVWRRAMLQITRRRILVAVEARGFSLRHRRSVCSFAAAPRVGPIGLFSCSERAAAAHQGALLRWLRDFGWATALSKAVSAGGRRRTRGPRKLEGAERGVFFAA